MYGLIIIPLWILALIWIWFGLRRIPRFLKREFGWGPAKRWIAAVLITCLPFMPDVYMRTIPYVIYFFEGGLIISEPVDTGGVVLVDGEVSSSFFTLTELDDIRQVKVENREYGDVFYKELWRTSFFRNEIIDFEQEVENFRNLHKGYIVNEFSDKNSAKYTTIKGREPKFVYREIKKKGYSFFYRRNFSVVEITLSNIKTDEIFFKYRYLIFDVWYYEILRFIKGQTLFIGFDTVDDNRFERPVLKHLILLEKVVKGDRYHD